MSEPEKVHLFSSQQVAEAHNLIMSKKAAATLDKGQQIDVAVGATVFWDGKSLSVIQIGEKKIVLQGENHQFLSVSVSQMLLRSRFRYRIIN